MKHKSDPIWVFPETEVPGLLRVRLSGDAYERGFTYGQAAADRIGISRERYAEVYLHDAGWSWEKARLEAKKFIAPIQEFNESYLQELQGVADGSGMDLLDVLAMNLRTEFLFAAKARKHKKLTTTRGECTSFAQIDSHSRVVAGQNWDWLTFSEETIVLLEVEQNAGPNYMTIVEAGLLAKFGMNSAGLVTLTNALCTSEDRGSAGVPYHIMLRALLDAQSPLEWIETLQESKRASSANYMLATSDGIALNAETVAGGFDRITWSLPNDIGLLSHANHLSELTTQNEVIDFGRLTMADSLFRLQRLRHQARQIDLGNSEQRSNVARQWQTLLGDHAGYPDSVCCHPNENAPELEAWFTAAAAVFEPATLEAHIHVGNPCADSWVRVSYSA